MERKAFNRPFWLMFVLLILIVAFYSFIYLFLKRQNGAEVASKNILKTEIIACIIIAMEAGVYLFFRRRLVKRVWAQTHVFLLYFASVYVVKNENAIVMSLWEKLFEII